MTADLSIRPDHALRRSPLHDWARTLTGLAPAVTLTERPYLTHTTVWVDPASAAGKAISIGLGVPLPTTAGTFTQGSTPFGDVQVLDAEAGDFQLLVRSSFAGYFASWIADAAAEYADPAQLAASL